MILNAEIKYAEPVVLRYAAGPSDDYKSMLAKVIANTISPKVDVQLATAFCSVVESMAHKSYIVNLYGSDMLQIKSSAPEFTCCITDTGVEDCKVGGMQYGAAVPILLTPYHIGFMSGGEILATCPVNAFMYILSRVAGRPVVLEDALTGGNPFLPGYYADSIKFITDNLVFTDTDEEETMRRDMRLMLEYVLKQVDNCKCYARFIWVDGTAIPIDVEGHVVEIDTYG